MGFGGLVRKAVALADTLTGGEDGLQADVVHYAYLSQDSKGKRTFRAAVTRAALVSYERKQVRGPGDTTIEVRATVLFPRPVAVDERDKILLPDGTTGPIRMKPDTMADPSTGKAYMTEVWLGA